MLSLVVRDTIFKTLHLLYTSSKNSLWPLLHSLLIWVKTTQCTNIHVYIPCEQLKPKSHLPKLMDLWRIGECCCEPCAEKKMKKRDEQLVTLFGLKNKILFQGFTSFKIKGNHNQDCTALVSVRVGGVGGLQSGATNRLIKNNYIQGHACSCHVFSQTQAHILTKSSTTSLSSQAIQEEEECQKTNKKDNSQCSAHHSLQCPLIFFWLLWLLNDWASSCKRNNSKCLSASSLLINHQKAVTEQGPEHLCGINTQGS